MTIGGSTADNLAERRISRNLGIKDGGWASYIQSRIAPRVAWGTRRFVLHNPFGSLPNEVMQLDQLLHARAAGLHWLEDDFVEAWRPVTDGAYGPVEIIAYFGTPVADVDFKALYEAGKRQEWLDRAWASIQPALDAGMSIALDMATGAEVEHPAWELVLALQQRGVKVYAEGLPAAPGRKLDHWLSINIIIMDKYYQNMGSSSWAAKPSDIKGELIILSPSVQHLSAQQRGKAIYDWLLRFLSTTPYTAAVPVHHIMDDYHLDDLLNQVDTRLTAQFD